MLFDHGFLLLPQTQVLLHIETSPFQALSTALSGTVGTGNIGGVAMAIFIGGPAALFWMWLTAFLGMTTKFVEVSLSHAYREKNNSGENCQKPCPQLLLAGRQWIMCPLILHRLEMFFKHWEISNTCSDVPKSRIVSNCIFNFSNGLLVCLLRSFIVNGFSFTAYEFLKRKESFI